jgi:hypothetical protein
MMVDDEYCNLSKQRNVTAATRTRTVRSYEDNRANHMALVANKRATDLATKRKVCKALLHRTQGVQGLTAQNARCARPYCTASLFLQTPSKGKQFSILLSKFA